MVQAAGIACGTVLAVFGPVRASMVVLLGLSACGKADVKAVELEYIPGDDCLVLGEDDDEITLRSCLALTPAAPADVAFVIDDGPGSLPLQRRLADAMPAFVDRILASSLPYDLRIAFESADVESTLRPPQACHAHPEDFSDLAQCEAVCDKVDGDARWVEIRAGETADRERLVEALRCGAMLGDAGPNVAEPLRSTINTWFSDDPFLRPAIRSAVIVTGEPECSRNRPQSLAGREIEDPDAARERCYAAGTLCDDLGCRPANLDHLGQETTDEEARLLPLEVVTDKLDALALQIFTYVDLVHLTAIAALPVAGNTDSVCEIDGTPLYPALRLAVLAEQSPLDVVSACEADWTQHLVPIAEKLADSFPMCMPACVADEDEDTPGLQVECEVHTERVDDQGRFRRVELPRCDEDRGSAGCWRPVTGDDRHPICAEIGVNLEITVELPEPPALNLAVFPRCTLSQDKSADCPDLR